MSEELIIISLTSFPKRIPTIHLVIESLLRQSYQNKRVLLWLSKKQFHNCEIPANLRRLCDRGLEILFVDDDIRSHKKYYYAFQQYPDNLIFLADDDLFYPSFLVKKSYELYKTADSDKVVVANYGREIKRGENGEVLSYCQWNIKSGHRKNDFFFGSGGGTLLRPRNLYLDVCKQELFLDLTPIADDIWLNAMTRLGDNDLFITDNYYPLPIKITDNEELKSKNMGGENLNDKQISALQNYYMKTLNRRVF